MLNTMLSLTQEQKDLIRTYIQSYKEYSFTEEGKETLEIHKTHHAFFSKKLSKDSIDKITENDYSNITCRMGMIMLNALMFCN